MQHPETSKIALVLACRPSWIDDHRRWRQEYGCHGDGLWNKKRRGCVIDLLSACRKHEDLHIYAYSVKHAGGDGLVRFRFKVTNLSYVEPPQDFLHHPNLLGLPLVHREPCDNRTARLTYDVVDVEPTGPFRLDDFWRFPHDCGVGGRGGGEKLRIPLQLLGLPCVVDPSP